MYPTSVCSKYICHVAPWLQLRGREFLSNYKYIEVCVYAILSQLKIIYPLESQYISIHHIGDNSLNINTCSKFYNTGLLQAAHNTHLMQGYQHHISLEATSTVQPWTQLCLSMPSFAKKQQHTSFISHKFNNVILSRTSTPIVQ